MIIGRLARFTSGQETADDATWLRSCLVGYLNGAERTVDAALGLQRKPGQRNPVNEIARRDRDDLIRLLH